MGNNDDTSLACAWSWRLRRRRARQRESESPKGRSGVECHTYGLEHAVSDHCKPLSPR